VPFWNPPNASASTTRITISSTNHSRQPTALDLGRHRRPLNLSRRRPNPEMLTGMLTSLGFKHITVTFGAPQR
jgi:hypothetical protein